MVNDDTLYVIGNFVNNLDLNAPFQIDTLFTSIGATFIQKLSLGLITSLDEAVQFLPPTSDYLLYPNPTQHSFKVQAKNGQLMQRLVLRNSLGQEVQRNTALNTNSFSLEINGPTGLYFVEILDTKNQRTVLKVVKE